MIIEPLVTVIVIRITSKLDRQFPTRQSWLLVIPSDLIAIRMRGDGDISYDATITLDVLSINENLAIISMNSVTLGCVLTMCGHAEIKTPEIGNWQNCCMYCPAV